MPAGAIVALSAGLGLIYGGMLLAIIFGLRMAGRDEEQH